MSSWIWWMVLAFGLLILELLTGTFYLLVIAVAIAAGGLTNLAGAPFELQLVVAAAIIEAMDGLDLAFPELDDGKRSELAAARQALEQEPG